MVFDLTDSLKLLDKQRSYAIDALGEDKYGMNSDKLYINTDNFVGLSEDTVRQITYYNGHVNMLEHILNHSGNNDKRLRVEFNKHYIV